MAEDGTECKPFKDDNEIYTKSSKRKTNYDSGWCATETDENMIPKAKKRCKRSPGIHIKN